VPLRSIKRYLQQGKGNKMQITTKQEAQLAKSLINYGFANGEPDTVIKNKVLNQTGIDKETCQKMIDVYKYLTA
jgi:hypothetical protein